MNKKTTFIQIFLIMLIVAGFFLTTFITSKSKAQTGTVPNSSQSTQPIYIPGPQVIGSGCVLRATSTNHLHFATAGQSAVGGAHGANNILYAGFWHMQASMTTGVEVNEETSLQISFELHQNYPNPFNPTTTISYEIPVSSNVELSIYSITEQKVETLVAEQQSSGYHEIEWDASSLASGVYFYRIRADGFEQMRKLILIK